MVSFFIVFESQADNDYKNCILLLDEPATSLHALKQKEFIKMKEEYLNIINIPKS